MGESTTRVQYAARYLIGVLAENPWEVTAGLKRGGKGRNGTPDETLHITIRDRKRENSYHLRFTNSLVLFDISCESDASLPGVKKYIRPGDPQP